MRRWEDLPPAARRGIRRRALWGRGPSDAITRAAARDWASNRLRSRRWRVPLAVGIGFLVLGLVLLIFTPWALVVVGGGVIVTIMAVVDVIQTACLIRVTRA